MKAKHTPTARELLIHVMQIDELEYGRMVMLRAEEYLYQVLLLDRTAKEAFCHSANFWYWWKYQWERRNRIMIAKMNLMPLYDAPSDPHLAAMITEEYQAIHSLKALNIVPNRVVMASSLGAFMWPAKKKQHA